MDLIAACCVLFLLVLTLGDGPSLLGVPSDVAYDGFRIAVYTLAVIAIVGAWLNRGSLAEFLEGLCATAAGPRHRATSNVVVGALVGVGLVLRAARVGEYGLNPDEAQFLNSALSRSVPELWRYATQESPHPLANVLILHFMTRISRNLLWLRLPSILSGAALILVGHRFATALLGGAAGLAMAVFLTFSPALIDLSRVCRNYAPGFALLVTALWFLARFLNSGRWRDFGLFALTELLASTWVSTFAIAFAGVNVALFAALVRRRAPFGAWMRALLFQLPTLVFLIFLWRYQLSRIPPEILAFHRMIYSAELSLGVHTLVEPLRGLWHFLVPVALGDGFLWLSLAGLAVLVLRGRVEPALFCAAPLALAYAAAWAGRLPLGETRHSVYLFPFLFALVAALVPETMRRRPATDARGAHAATLHAARASTVVATGLAVAAAIYVGASLLDYGTPPAFASLPFGRGRDLARYYRQEHVTRSFELLEQRATKEDVVLVSVSGVFALRAHLAMCQTPLEESEISPWQFRGHGPLRYEHRGVTFYMAPPGGLRLTPETLMRAVEEVRARYGVGRTGKVWAIRSAWEVPLADGIRSSYPNARIDTEVSRLTNDWLFAVDASSLPEPSAH
jgi:hypothetical protein